MKLVRIQDGVVAELITLPKGVLLAEAFHPDIVANIVEAPNSVEQGHVYADGKFAPPPPDAAPEPPAQRQFTFLEFMDLFTEAEQLTLVEASMTLPPVKLWYDKALGAHYIDLDDPRMEPGLQALVDANLITAGRKATVLSGERPNEA